MRQVTGYSTRDLCLSSPGVQEAAAQGQGPQGRGRGQQGMALRREGGEDGWQIQGSALGSPGGVLF